MKSPRNNTLTITANEILDLQKNIIQLTHNSSISDIHNKIINQDTLDVIKFLPDQFIDLLIIDPPYNLSKTYSKTKFNKQDTLTYQEYIDSWLSQLVRCLKSTASIYVCCDWSSSREIQNILEKYFVIRNRITWEREKGRGAKRNFKNCSEDIWFCTMSDDFYFDVEAIKLNKKVTAPYKDKNGNPKDWTQTKDGNFRKTFPSNIWTDITVPFWSMKENTDHPTQKPEKLIAKLLLASSKEGDMVFDPFLGSGTTAVVAKKLKRNFSGIEREEEYCHFASKRLVQADSNNKIQGYSDGVFWDRNSEP